MTNTHIMIDIETLSLSKRAVVLSIGAVRFGNNFLSVYTYESCPFVQSQIDEGRKIDYDTIKFWKCFKKEVRL